MEDNSEAKPREWEWLAAATFPLLGLRMSMVTEHWLALYRWSHPTPGEEFR